MNLLSFSHLIQIILFPPGLVLLLILVGFLLGWRIPWVGKLFVFSGIMILWALSTPLIAQYLIDGLQSQYPPLALTEPQGKAAIVVLASGIELAPEYSHRYRPTDNSLGRLHYAVYMERYTHLPIIVSGGNRYRDVSAEVHTEADAMREVLTNSYHTSTFAVENTSQNTEQESKRLIPILLQHHIHTIYVVTNAWHMPRAMYIFNRSLARFDLKALPAPMGYITLKSSDWFVNYFPSIKALDTSIYALHEYTGLIWYRFFLYP